MKTPSDNDLTRLRISHDIAVLESRFDSRLRRMVPLAVAALGFRLLTMDTLMLVSVTLAVRDLAPGVLEYLLARRLRRVFSSMDCG